MPNEWPTILLLPGMDGTGLLFEPFRRALPVDFPTEIVTYPTQQALNYDQLLEQINLPNRPFVIVAESFSGPIAMKLAAHQHRHLIAVVLVATFARCPRPISSWLLTIAAPIMFRLQPPAWALRWALLGDRATAEEVRVLTAALAAVHHTVFAKRMRSICKLDVRSELSRICVPVLYVAPTQDRLVPPATSYEMIQVLPSMERVTIDGPHLLLQQRPSEAAAVVMEFIRRQLKTDGAPRGGPMRYR